MEQISLKQTEFWDEYTDRTNWTSDELNALYLKLYSKSRDDMNREFIGDMDRGIGILEVGCGTGMQLTLLRNMGFPNMTGVDWLPYACQIATENGFNVYNCAADALPFVNNSFDMIFTSGLLIHIPPEQLPTVMKEIIRCTRQWIWGLEYFETEITPVEYRTDILWKADYAELYKEQSNNLHLIKETRFPRDGNCLDTMFLLEKINA